MDTIFHTKQYGKQLSELWGNESVLSSAWQKLNCAFPWYVRLIAQSFKQRNAMFHVERKKKKSDVVESVYVLLSGNLIMCAETPSRIAMFHVEQYRKLLYGHGWMRSIVMLY